MDFFIETELTEIVDFLVYLSGSLLVWKADADFLFIFFPLLIVCKSRTFSSPYVAFSSITFHSCHGHPIRTILKR